MSGYVGKPDVRDVAGQYRFHAQKIADGIEARPSRVILIELDVEGNPTLRTFGPPYESHREAIGDLLAACAYLNAEASN